MAILHCSFRILMQQIKDGLRGLCGLETLQGIFQQGINHRMAFCGGNLKTCLLQQKSIPPHACRSVQNGAFGFALNFTGFDEFFGTRVLACPMGHAARDKIHMQRKILQLIL